MISDVLAKILEADRSRFNARFAEARWRRPKLVPEDWADLLCTTVAPLVEAVDRARPDRAAETTAEAYDLALDLLGQELLGPRCPYPAVVAGWEKLLPVLAEFVAEAPRPVLGAVTNALYNLSTTPGARPFDWIGSLRHLAEIGPEGLDVSTLLQAGQVAAWRAGLAHYRWAALEISTRLAEVNLPAALAALGLPADCPASLPDVIDRLAADPWLSPVAAMRGAPKGNAPLRLMARVGDFRGLGGEFLTPPLVVAAEGRLMVREGEHGWWLTADIFGAVLHRAPALDLKPQTTVPRAWKPALGASGPAGCPHPQTISSLAATETTLAVTSSLSHRVYLLAFADDGV